MSDPVVRSITLHARNPPSWSGEQLSSYVEELASNLQEAHDSASSEIGLSAWTLRVTLPNPSPETLGEAVAALSGLDFGGALVSLGGIPTGIEALESLVAEVTRETLYIHLYFSGEWDEARRIARLMNALAEEDPMMATRLGVNVLGEGILTPFYPLSWSPGDETLVTVALTYPSYLASAYMNGGLEALVDSAIAFASKALKLAEAVARHVNARVAGVDLSVAPWMRDSSLGLVELVAGARLPEPGVAWGISRINMALAMAAVKLGKAVGFNSVQLPVAEDLKMKARVSEGDVTARDLARLSGACLAGLDMAVIPYEEDKVAGLILEVAAYSKAKGLPLGVRLIPLEGVEPGDKIGLDRFGETPVLRI